MAKADGIAAGHPIKAAWKEMWGHQCEALSLCEVFKSDNLDAESWSYLARGVLQRFSDAADVLQRAYTLGGLSPLTSYEPAADSVDDDDLVETGTIGQAGVGAVNGGMGAVAPMGTEVVDGELTSSRK